MYISYFYWINTFTHFKTKPVIQTTLTFAVSQLRCELLWKMSCCCCLPAPLSMSLQSWRTERPQKAGLRGPRAGLLHGTQRASSGHSALMQSSRQTLCSDHVVKYLRLMTPVWSRSISSQIKPWDNCYFALRRFDSTDFHFKVSSKTNSITTRRVRWKVMFT